MCASRKKAKKSKKVKKKRRSKTEESEESEDDDDAEEEEEQVRTRDGLLAGVYFLFRSSLSIITITISPPPLNFLIKCLSIDCGCL